MAGRRAFVRAGAAALALAVALSACGQLPQPFKREGAPGSLARPRIVRGVSIRPIDGLAHADKLAAAMATAMAERDIPAQVRDTEPPGAFVIDGLASEDGDTIEILWWLRSPDKASPASLSQRVPMARWERGDSAYARQLAREAAAVLAAPLREPELERPVIAAASRPAVRLVPPKGLPGDGDTSLAKAMRVALERAGVLLRDEGGDYIVSGAVLVAPGPPGEDALDVAWTVKTPDGTQLGVAQQHGNVVKGQLNQPWGGLARDIAAGGAEGVAEIVSAASKGRGSTP